MRNFLLLVLVCVIVTESKADDVKSLLLKESIDSAKIILNNSSNEVRMGSFYILITFKKVAKCGYTLVPS